MGAAEPLRRCPQCKADLEKTSAALRDIAELTFCLECQFPVLLVAGKYRLQKLLAQGGFGKVYLARHVHLDRDPERVVKILHREVFSISGMESRFRREVQVTSALSQINEHIVRIYDDFGVIPKLGHFYVMEYLQGAPLTQLVANPKRLPSLKLCFHIFSQLCEALEVAHREEVVHRDLKPDNIFLIQRDADPYFVKILDFGIAKPLDLESLQSTQMTQGTLGTPPYMSPEQCNDEALDHRADIYSMGVVLYELLVGRTPFFERDKPSSALRVLHAHLTQPPPSLRKLRPDRKIPEEVEAVVLKALSKSPADRYPTALHFKQALTEAYASAGLHPTQAFSSGEPPPLPAVTPETLDTWEQPNPRPRWPVADSTSFPQKQRQQIEGVRGIAGSDSAANQRMLASSSGRETGEQLADQQLPQAHHGVHPRPLQGELPSTGALRHHDSDQHPVLSEGFNSYQSGLYNINCLGAEPPLEDDDDLRPLRRSYHPLLGLIALLLLGGLWTVMVVSSWKERRKTMSTLLPQAGATCGDARNHWKDGALRLLIIPLNSAHLPLPIAPKAARLVERQRAIHAKILAGLRQAVGPLAQDFLSIHESAIGLNQPDPTLNHRRAELVGKLCHADLVLSGGWLTTGDMSIANPTNATHKQPDAWMRLFTTYTSGPIPLYIQQQRVQLSAPPPLDELLHSHAASFPNARLKALIRGLTYLKAAQRIRKSPVLAPYLLSQGFEALKHAQVLDLTQPLLIKKIALNKLKLRPMVQVPAGRFWMGPPQKAVIKELPTFWIDQYEVSRERYAICVLRGQCQPLRNFIDPDWALPRDRITTKAAAAFCAAEGKALPTEEQWVKAARGGITLHGKPNPYPKRPYPWGMTPRSCKYAHVLKCYRKLIEGELIAVMISTHRPLLGVSPYGVHHMLGNAAEILQDGSIKGGSGYSSLRTISWKSHMDQRDGLSWVGFRCVKNEE